MMVKSFSFLLENSLVPIYTDKLESVGAVVAKELLESDRQTLTCDIDPFPISIYVMCFILSRDIQGISISRKVRKNKKLESVHRAQTPPQYMPYQNRTIFD